MVHIALGSLRRRCRQGSGCRSTEPSVATVRTCVWPRVNIPRAVDSRQQTDFCGKRTDLIHASAVNTLLLVEQPAAHDKLLRQIHALVDLLPPRSGINFVEVLVHFFVNGLESLVANASCRPYRVRRFTSSMAKSRDFFEHLRVRLIGRVRRTSSCRSPSGYP